MTRDRIGAADVPTDADALEGSLPSGKASNGEGSLYLDADGSWRATYVAPGSARPKRVRGKTREEAIARRAVKLEELCQIQSSTYSQRVERITNTIGQLPARSLKPERIARWQSDLLKSGLASGTVANVRVTLHQVLEQAVLYELIASNPVDRVAAPKVVRGPRRALVSADARNLVESASDDRLGAVVPLLFTNERGGLVNRHAAAKAVTRAATRAGIDPKGIATHTGRRTAGDRAVRRSRPRPERHRQVRRPQRRGDDCRLREVAG